MIVDLGAWPGQGLVLEVLLAEAEDCLPGQQMDLRACLVGGICHQRRGECPCVIFPQVLDLAHNPNSRLECPPTMTVVRECRY